MSAAREVELLVIGGGISGAGIALEAARRGIEVTLIEARDFAWGSSSRSSKLVHGGLRYLLQGQPALTRISVHERSRLLREAPGLVAPQSFLMAHYAHRAPGRHLLGAGLWLYDAFAGQRSRRYHDREEALWLAPHLRREGLLGATTYLDATTDDARLVLRVLQEARALGARTLNYHRAESLLREDGRVVGVRMRGPTGERRDVRACVVVHAAGAWADGLRADIGGAPKLRPLRGSHLLFPLWRLPLGQAVAFRHPRDGRPVFAYPWEGAALVGTTDEDQPGDLWHEPGITRRELDYLFEALAWQFPELALGEGDLLSTFAGVRPVVASGQAEPSREKRDELVIDEDGLLTVTGGKLTTFRAEALDALARLATRLPAAGRSVADPLFAHVAPVPALAALDGASRARLLARYGVAAANVLAVAQAGELDAVPGTATPWAELRHAARHEQVRHLDDLLLRRTRLGLLLREGGAAILPRVGEVARQELGWDERRWRAEVRRYRAIIRRSYSVPSPDR